MSGFVSSMVPIESKRTMPVSSDSFSEVPSLAEQHAISKVKGLGGGDFYYGGNHLPAPTKATLIFIFGLFFVSMDSGPTRSVMVPEADHGEISFAYSKGSIGGWRDRVT